MHKIVKNGIKFLKDQNIPLNLTNDAKEFLVQISNGDARIVLNALDALAISGMQKARLKDIQRILQENPNRYDKKGDEHYNTISAYIKSMRAGKISAALYYLARMVNAGEDPLFIARRMVIFASEDIGIANTSAIIVANEVFKACETIGYPECQINLAHGTTFLSLSKKSRKSCDAYFKALDDVKKYGNLEIPLQIRNAPTKLMKNLGYGKNYGMYPSKEISYLPKDLAESNYY